RGHLIEGGLGGSPKIVNPPGADPLDHEYAQGRTSKMTYNDADQKWSWDNSNYMFGTFTVDNVQYQKYAAGLAQKMAQMKNHPASQKNSVQSRPLKNRATLDAASPKEFDATDS